MGSVSSNRASKILLTLFFVYIVFNVHVITEKFHLSNGTSNIRFAQLCSAAYSTVSNVDSCSSRCESRIIGIFSHDDHSRLADAYSYTVLLLETPMALSISLSMKFDGPSIKLLFLSTI
jgi:hypothetical protein